MARQPNKWSNPAEHKIVFPRNERRRLFAIFPYETCQRSTHRSTSMAAGALELACSDGALRRESNELLTYTVAGLAAKRICGGEGY